jgi:hypothetical protein
MLAEILQLESNGENGKLKYCKQLEKATELSSIKIRDGVAMWKKHIKQRKCI